MNYKQFKSITMKSLVKMLGLLFILAVPVCLKAQTMEESLNKAFLQMDSVKSFSDMMSVSAQFDMIASKWENEWSNKKKDLFLDEADKYLEKIKPLDSQNGETYVLAALITSARIAVDGQNRGMQYSGILNQDLEKAEKINPDNPRIYYLKGSALFYQPEMYGGGKTIAKPYFEKAKELFVKETKTSILKPHWGEKQNLDFLKQCDEK